MKSPKSEKNRIQTYNARNNEKIYFIKFNQGLANLYSWTFYFYKCTWHFSCGYVHKKNFVNAQKSANKNFFFWLCKGICPYKLM